MHRAGSGKFSILRLIPEARRTCAPAQARQCASVRRREGSLDQGKSAPKTTRRRKKALGCGHAPSRKRQMFYPAPDTGSPAYLRSCPSATVRKCEAKRRQFGRAISEAIKVIRTTPPLWGPLPGAIVSIIRSVCSALLRARSDQTPPAVGQGTIARPS